MKTLLRMFIYRHVVQTLFINGRAFKIPEKKKKKHCKRIRQNMKIILSHSLIFRRWVTDFKVEDYSITTLLEFLSILFLINIAQIELSNYRRSGMQT